MFEMGLEFQTPVLNGLGPSDGKTRGWSLHYSRFSWKKSFMALKGMQWHVSKLPKIQ